jgi:hypothetical protein
MRLNPYLVRPGLALVTGVQGDGGDETESEGGTQDAGEQEADIEAGAEMKQHKNQEQQKLKQQKNRIIFQPNANSSKRTGE